MIRRYVAVIAAAGLCGCGTQTAPPPPAVVGVPQHVLEQLVERNVGRTGGRVVAVYCERGVYPGSGQEASCTVVRASGESQVMRAAVTHDYQLVLTETR